MLTDLWLVRTSPARHIVVTLQAPLKRPRLSATSDVIADRRRVTHATVGRSFASLHADHAKARGHGLRDVLAWVGEGWATSVWLSPARVQSGSGPRVTQDPADIRAVRACHTDRRRGSGKWTRV